MCPKYRKMPMVQLLKKRQEAEQAKAKEVLPIPKQSEQQQAQRQEEAKVRTGKSGERRVSLVQFI